MQIINKAIKKNFHIIFNLLLILSVYMGFFFDENLTQGPQLDFEHALKQVKAFEENFKYTFLNYDKIENSTRISPVFTATIYLINKLTDNVDITRFILCNLILLSQYVLFSCLKNSNLNLLFSDNQLFLISSIIYISPSFRANSIWPESSMLGLLFFLISLLCFLKFETNNNIKFFFLNVFFLAIASYVRPSFCLFAFYFFIKFLSYSYKYDKFYRNLSLVIFLNLVLAFPAFYYVFFLDVFFISYGGLDSNYFNKVSIISTIIFFHLLPILYFFKEAIKPKFSDDFSIVILVLISLIFIIYFFDYNLKLAGGGFFLHLSNFLFENNYLFYFVFCISAFYILKIIKQNKVDNLIIILILLLITPQYHIFHKYYDPLVIILAMTLIKLKQPKELNLNNKFIIVSYVFYIFYNFTHLINNYFNL